MVAVPRRQVIGRQLCQIDHRAVDGALGCGTDAASRGLSAFVYIYMYVFCGVV